MYIRSDKIRKQLSSRLTAYPDRKSELVECEMRFIDVNYLDDVVALQETMARALPDKEIFRLSSRDCLRDAMAKERSAIGVLTKDGLIAYHLLSIPGCGDNFGADIGLPESELCNVAHIKAVVVHPSYRGNSLHRKMTSVHMNVLKDWGFWHVCCTVSPKNLYSLRNFLACGMVIKGLRIKYEGLLRYILYERLIESDSRNPRTSSSGDSFDSPDFPDSINSNDSTGSADSPECMEAINEINELNEINMISTDIEGQRDLLRRGYFGCRAEGHPDGFRIAYRKI